MLSYCHMALKLGELALIVMDEQFVSMPTDSKSGEGGVGGQGEMGGGRRWRWWWCGGGGGGMGGGGGCMGGSEMGVLVVVMVEEEMGLVGLAVVMVAQGGGMEVVMVVGMEAEGAMEVAVAGVKEGAEAKAEVRDMEDTEVSVGGLEQKVG
ncbi:hypothetical protein CYMTET_6796 [Cymbomonas tetramitiformis]|uniref:Uncharacterized protein n=1 Tax=Cymbomonas tetramitiformis TaxID=36881 RepID=A0AAE0LI44_9CHLO|nr:hypothetical protein CYMTET_6796 [Cymbomonas tetramitiformis]